MANKKAGTDGIKCYYRQTKKLEPAMRKLPPTEENVSTGELKSWNRRNQMLLPANRKGWRELGTVEAVLRRWRPRWRGRCDRRGDVLGPAVFFAATDRE